MKQANGYDCGGRHLQDEKSLSILTINGRRYTVCSHQVDNDRCGALIDVTDLAAVVYCCGIESNHRDRPVLGLD